MTLGGWGGIQIFEFNVTQALLILNFDSSGYSIKFRFFPFPLSSPVEHLRVQAVQVTAGAHEGEGRHLFSGTTAWHPWAPPTGRPHTTQRLHRRPAPQASSGL